VPDVLVAGFLDAVGVVASSLDDAGAGAVPAPGVEVLFPRDVGLDLGQDGLSVLRGKAGSATRRRRMRTVRLNLTRSGSMPTAVAAVQIRALIA
jgi:hypothetical protein